MDIIHNLAAIRVNLFHSLNFPHTYSERDLRTAGGGRLHRDLRERHRGLREQVLPVGLLHASIPGNSHFSCRVFLIY